MEQKASVLNQVKPSNALKSEERFLLQSTAGAMGSALLRRATCLLPKEIVFAPRTVCTGSAQPEDAKPTRVKRRLSFV